MKQGEVRVRKKEAEKDQNLIPKTQNIKI